MQMRRPLACFVTVFWLAAGMAAAEDEVGRENVVVMKYGDLVYVRSRLSSTQHVVNLIGLGSKSRRVRLLGAVVVPHDAPMTREGFEDGPLLHYSVNDTTPWNLNGTHIGGSRGASVVLRITAPAHGLSMADVGSAWRDDADVTFYVLNVLGADELLVISENTGTPPSWSFVQEIQGDRLLETETERTLPFTASSLIQLRPACRISKQECLLDGIISFPDTLPVTCGYLDIVEDLDIICPDAVLESAKKNPGKKVNALAEGLDAVVSSRIVHRFLPEGACVVLDHSTARRAFKLGHMGFVQSSALHKADFDTHEYYIPKTLPFRVDDRSFDFLNRQDSSLIDRPCVFSKDNGNIADGLNLPDRYIQLLGTKTDGKITRKIGYALGYSLIEGITRPKLRSRNVLEPVRISASGMTCPRAIDTGMAEVVEAGTVFECTAYRQYFDATAGSGATCVYGHRQGDNYVLYADYHRSVEKDIVQLPESQVGKTIEIVEKTPSVTILSGDTVPPAGLVLSVTDGYGYVVVKVVQ